MTINSRLDGWKKKELGRIMIKMIQYQTKPWRQPMLNINRQTDPQNIGHLTEAPTPETEKLNYAYNDIT